MATNNHKTLTPTKKNKIIIMTIKINRSWEFVQTVMGMKNYKVRIKPMTKQGKIK
jgi:hypothetical protein